MRMKNFLFSYLMPNNQRRIFCPLTQLQGTQKVLFNSHSFFDRNTHKIDTKLFFCFARNELKFACASLRLGFIFYRGPKLTNKPYQIHTQKPFQTFASLI
jgi:hypothetical protein